jgi:tRNA-splicing ligase RtcB
MRVPGLIFATEQLLDIAAEEQALEQVANVAFLPGIVKYSLAMPDVHWGYGFPIGGVAAMRVTDGVISPAGVGFDINCGTRVIATSLTEEDVRPRLRTLIDQVFRDVPAGVGASGQLRVSATEIWGVLSKGAAWAVEAGHGWPEDLEVMESGGRLQESDPSLISSKAKDRGLDQLGTLGAGNHFLEVQVVDELYQLDAAAAMGIFDTGQVLVFVHTGSRGLGHQTCQDHLEVMEEAAARYDIYLPDRQLACTPIRSLEGERYVRAMSAAANFAFCNRQVITNRVRDVFSRIFGRPARDLGMSLIYDVAHNTAKFEEHVVDGEATNLCVHRKGATRSFGPGHPELPTKYRQLGQPVLIPGDMGRYSYICVGTPRAMAETWGSSCHGAGRVQSRHAARRMLKGVNLRTRLEELGIYVRARHPGLLAEEASEAYKDVAIVVNVLDGADIAKRVCRMRPIGVVKG